MEPIETQTSRARLLPLQYNQSILSISGNRMQGIDRNVCTIRKQLSYERKVRKINNIMYAHLFKTVSSYTFFSLQVLGRDSVSLFRWLQSHYLAECRFTLEQNTDGPDFNLRPFDLDKQTYTKIQTHLCRFNIYKPAKVFINHVFFA